MGATLKVGGISERVPDEEFGAVEVRSVRVRSPSLSFAEHFETTWPSLCGKSWYQRSHETAPWL